MEWLEGLKELELFEAIEAALAIAAKHYPKELRRRRDAFAEQLFAPQALESSQCDLLQPGDCLRPQDSGEVGVRNKQRVQNQHQDQEKRRREEEQEEEEEEEEVDGEEVEAEEEEEVEVEEEEAEEHVEEERDRQEQRGREQVREEGTGGMGEEYDEVEALTDQMEEESRQIQEINRIKMRITDLEMDDEELLVLLETLQEMQISVEALKETEIGKEVNGLRKHRSKRIRSLARLLVRGWKDMVNDWVKSAGDVAAAALAGSSSGSTQDDHGENGLPSPPLEPGALLAAAHPPSAELFQLFDEGWDDDLTAGPGPSPTPCNGTRTYTQPHQSGPAPQRREIRASSPDLPVANMKSRVSASNPNKPLKRVFEQTAAVDVNMNRTAKVSRVSLASPRQHHDHPIDSTSPLKVTSKGVVGKGGSQSSQMIANKPKVHQGMPRTLEDTSVAARLEVAKRRLQERYQEVENAKKSRVVQVMDLTELPKGGPNRARGPQAHKPWTQNNKRQQHSRR